jgi:hypothetical protein
MSTLLEQASLVMIPSGYKEDVVYSQIPTNGNGDLSFTRASNGTRVNSAGLVEVCPWNLFEQSENVPNAVWGKSTLTFNSTVTAPNGTSTAQNYSTAGAYSYAIQTITVSSGEYYTVSCYLKYTSGVGGISIGYTDAPSVNFIRVDANLINGTIGSVSYGGNGANGTATITSVGDGWYRVTVSGTLIIGTAGLIVSNLALGATTFSIWGAQLNIGSTAKPYFPTTDRLNVPRLTYQNGGGGCPSLLLEKQSTNLAPYSEDATQWLLGSIAGTITVTANQTISPDGTQNADKIQFPAVASSGAYAVTYYEFTASATAYSGTIYLKGNSGGEVIYIMYTPDGTNYTKVTCTLTTEWQRFNLTSTLGAGTQYFQIGVDRRDTTQNAQNAQTIFVWGRQLEQSSYPTSYIPTTSASATRVEDACFKTGISSLIGQTEGVIYIDWVYTRIDTNGIIPITIGSNSLNHAYIFIEGNNKITFDFIVSGGAAGRIQTANGYAVEGTRYKMAFAYKANDFAAYINGQLIGTDNSGAIVGLSELYFSYPYGSGYNFPNTMNQAILFPTRLTNAELASLTTI